MSANNYFHIDKDGTFSTALSIEETLEKLKSGGYVWLSFNQPTLDELNKISAPLGLHPLSIEDCLDENQIPKVDEFPSNTFILFNAFRYSNKELSIDEINFFVGKNFLVTVNRIDNANQSFFSGVQESLRQAHLNVKKGPAFLLHFLLDYVVDQKFVALETLQEEIDCLEDKLLDSFSEFDLREIQRVRRYLLVIRKDLFHEKEILVKLCRKDSPFIPEYAIYDFRDIYDHIVNIFELTENLREIVTGMTGMHLSIMNNKMSKMANQTNFTVRRLTYITTIFMPLTLLAGIGGMSEWSMMTGPENWKISYPLFTVGMLVVGVLNYFFLKFVGEKIKDIES